jgi:1,4-alpha-glucan branching enzyme
MSLLSKNDLYLFNEGTHTRLYQKMGSHLVSRDGVAGAAFAVWAPSAERVYVLGDFNGWDRTSHPLQARESSGIWETFIPGVQKGCHYKYYVVSRYMGYTVEKADPFANFQEMPPKTASIVWDLDYQWGDGEWMARRADFNSLSAPMSVYEVHLGSWMRIPEEGYRSLSYREMAHRLAEYVQQMGFTHVEFMPVMEHPFFGSWGYQTTGFFAPSSRYGSPQDFMYLVDHLHQHGIGIFLDWVPSHFPSDLHGLVYFDGSHLFEHADPQQGYHPDWHSLVFNYGRHEVRSFLTSSGLFWLDRYHVDGIRVDAVASMLYLDYSRRQGEWVPNKYGSNENLEAISFLRRFNEEVYRSFPDTQTFAEESTAWSMVSRPTYVGGLGFGLKWDMGWMHDTLRYMSLDPVYRRHHHGELCFRMVYAFSENFILPLSHDEVVHGKGSLLSRMPGDPWQQFANLRLLYGYMFGQPGKKLLFMGDEFGQGPQWNHDGSVEWQQLGIAPHAGIQLLVKDLNRIHRHESALHELDCDPAGFEWIDFHDGDAGVLLFLRKSRATGEIVLVGCNFTPVLRKNYRTGVPRGGFWKEILNTDALEYKGSGQGNGGGLEAERIPWHGRPFSIDLTLPPLAVVFLKSAAG